MLNVHFQLVLLWTRVTKNRQRKLNKTNPKREEILKECINELKYRGDETISENFKRVLIKIMYFPDVTQNKEEKCCRQEWLTFSTYMLGMETEKVHTLKIKVLQNIAMFNMITISWYFEEAYCFYLQSKL
jgi:hypothetical protein